MKSAVRIAAFTLLFVVVILLAQTLYAQEQEETVQVPKSMLSKQQLDELTAKDMQRKVEQYGKWVGIGHEVGTAVNEGLSAINTQSNAFANTKVGKWTIFVIVFKVIGVPLMGVLFGLGTIVIGLPLWLWSFKKWLPRRVLDKEIVDKDTQKVVERRYVDFEHRDANDWLIAHIFFICALFAASAAAIFASF